ncbi:37S ribosomal protein S17, mitochondrial [Cytospora mali]|uniref:37S ribosomal protein S17, mitochondrial n=1 Tax=Cytospora mali TaxID=578113 RepID=A0A194W6X5_CYTMA|nr:37S ribosomal protein S17, mitochondrial [Valsa mali]
MSTTRAVANTVATATRLAGHVTKEMNGVVVSAGLAQKTAKVSVAKEEWNKKIKKHFGKSENYLVHDPNESLRTGDIVSIVSGWRTSKHKRHVVNRIIAPWGPPLDERAPLPTPEEREAEHAAKRAKKLERKELRKQTMAMEAAVAKAEKKMTELKSLAKEFVKDVDVKTVD